MSVTRVLAKMALETKTEDLTPTAVQAAQRLILDTLGTAIAGYNAPGVPEVRELVTEWGGKEEAHVLVYGGKLPAPNAAFLNSTMVHALDLDDVQLPATLHIMSSMLPVTFAVGEMTQASGNDVMAAIAMGIEVAARIGVEHKKYRKHDGFLPSSIDGGFGVAAAACRLLGMDEEATVNAMGIFYAQASGNRQALLDLTLTKRIQPAIAAKAGLWAALLARKGFTGPENAIEGKAGFFRIYGSDGGEIEVKESDFAGNRDFFQIERTGLKFFPTCGAHHSAILAAIELSKEHDLQPEQIDKVEYYLGEGGSTLVGRPFEAGSQPQVAAQFCAPFAIARALVRRRIDARDISDEAVLADKEVLAVSDKTELLTHWDYDADSVETYEGYPRYFGRPQMVQVHTKDGRTLQKTRTQRDVLHPDLMNYEDVAEKFRVCAGASGICPSDKAGAIVESVKNMESITNIGEFITEHLLLV